MAEINKQRGKSSKTREPASRHAETSAQGLNMRIAAIKKEIAYLKGEGGHMRGHFNNERLQRAQKELFEMRRALSRMDEKPNREGHPKPIGIGKPLHVVLPSRENPTAVLIHTLAKGFGLTQIQLATLLLHCSPRSLALWKAGTEPNAAALIRLKELQRLLQALETLMPPEEIGPWMKRTNDDLDPLTPLEVLNRGQMDRLWHIIYNVGSGMPT